MGFWIMALKFKITTYLEIILIIVSFFRRSIIQKLEAYLETVFHFYHCVYYCFEK